VSRPLVLAVRCEGQADVTRDPGLRQGRDCTAGRWCMSRILSTSTDVLQEKQRCLSTENARSSPTLPRWRLLRVLHYPRASETSSCKPWRRLSMEMTQSKMTQSTTQKVHNSHQSTMAGYAFFLKWSKNFPRLAVVCSPLFIAHTSHGSPRLDGVSE
jgi:hypothetical protein